MKKTFFLCGTILAMLIVSRFIVRIVDATVQIDNDIGMLNSLEHSGCYIVFAARSNACYYNLSHINCKVNIII